MKRIIVLIILIFGAFDPDVRGQNSRASGNGENTKVILPIKDGSVRFAIVGDTGTGKDAQRQVAETMLRYRNSFPFEFVLMLGDNLYGGEDSEDFTKKFENVYRELLGSGVKFYATLGNHDNSNQRNYKHFNMEGKEFYSFKKGNARFWSLNSNYMDQRQVEWMEDELKNDNSEWKICFFHHPPYSSGKQHGSNRQLQKVTEPIFVKYGIDVVFAGHEHFYERIKPQKGIYYFISGAGGKLRPGDVKATNITEKSFDQDLHFMIVEIIGDSLYFQVISRTGKTIDSGVLKSQPKEKLVAK
jgi:hypothetical protein